MRTGYVGLSHHDGIEFAESAALHKTQRVLPIDIPIGGKDLSTADSLRNGCRACLLSQEYTPALPKSFSCNFTLDVLDEDDLSEMIQGDPFEQGKLRIDKKQIKEALEEVLQETSDKQFVTELRDLLAELEEAGDDIHDTAFEDRAEHRQEAQRAVADKLKKAILIDQELFPPSLTFLFNITLVLPTHNGHCQSPRLTNMTLSWPGPISKDRLRLDIIEEQTPDWVQAWDVVETITAPARYVPEKGAIQWGDISFVDRTKSSVSSTQEYGTPMMDLSVEHPGELYPRKEELKGRLEISMPRLLSGLEAECFGADGKRISIPIEQETVLNVDFMILLEDCFRKKIFTPYRHLQFEGVILDEMRIADIQTILKNQGLTVSHVDLTKKGSRVRRFRIWGQQGKGAEPLEIWLWVEGTSGLTKRQREIPGGQTFTTNVETGQTTIYLRGRYRGDSKLVTTLMNTIHQKLKGQFPYVSTVD